MDEQASPYVQRSPEHTGLNMNLLTSYLLIHFFVKLENPNLKIHINSG